MVNVIYIFMILVKQSHFYENYVIIFLTDKPTRPFQRVTKG